MTAPDPGLVDGRRTVGTDTRVTAAARALADQLWRGGFDEQYHFLLYLCGLAAATVLATTDTRAPDESMVRVARSDLARWANQMEAAASLVGEMAGGTAREALHRIAGEIAMRVVSRD